MLQDNPVLLYGSTEGGYAWTSIYAFVTACVGVLALASGLSGLPTARYAGRVTGVRILGRVLLVTAGILLISPGLLTDVAAVAMIGVQILIERLFLIKARPLGA